MVRRCGQTPVPVCIDSACMHSNQCMPCIMCFSLQLLNLVVCMQMRASMHKQQAIVMAQQPPTPALLSSNADSARPTTNLLASSSAVLVRKYSRSSGLMQSNQRVMWASALEASSAASVAGEGAAAVLLPFIRPRWRLVAATVSLPLPLPLPCAVGLECCAPLMPSSGRPGPVAVSCMSAAACGVAKGLMLSRSFLLLRSRREGADRQLLLSLLCAGPLSEALDFTLRHQASYRPSRRSCPASLARRASFCCRRSLQATNWYKCSSFAGQSLLPAAAAATGTVTAPLRPETPTFWFFRPSCRRCGLCSLHP